LKGSRIIKKKPLLTFSNFREGPLNKDQLVKTFSEELAARYSCDFFHYRFASYRWARRHLTWIFERTIEECREKKSDYQFFLQRFNANCETQNTHREMIDREAFRGLIQKGVILGSPEPHIKALKEAYLDKSWKEDEQREYTAQYVSTDQMAEIDAVVNPLLQTVAFREALELFLS
jgi:hypothetical protein